MMPTIDEAKNELEIAAQLNPGPWIKHSLNVGIAARNIAQKVPHLDENKAYIKGWDTTFHNKEYFEKITGCSIYDVLPDIEKTTLLCPPPWKPTVSKSIGNDK